MGIGAYSLIELFILYNIMQMTHFRYLYKYVYMTFTSQYMYM